MKKILFLTYCYPYGHFGPSDNCTVRVMDALVRTGKYEVWNLSYQPKTDNSKPNFNIVDGVKLLYLPFPELRKHHSYVVEHLLLFLKIPFYPIYNPISIWRHYIACKSILKDHQFDLVVSQCAPQESVISGTLLKKNKVIDNMLVLFWDNIYGKYPRRVVPKWFSLRRSRIVENWIARYSDRMVSPTPVEHFHIKYGEVKEAIGKRIYLDHPSIMPPIIGNVKSTEQFVKKDRINIIYAGRIYFKEHLAYCIKLLGETSWANRINLILLTKGLSDSDLASMTKDFQGDVVLSGWISLNELNALYEKSDFCISFCGYTSSAVASKVYEYMCYGNAIIHFYEDIDDVTKQTVSRYPHGVSVCLKEDYTKYVKPMDDFLKDFYGRKISFEEVERLFPLATGSAYISVIDKMLK